MMYDVVIVGGGIAGCSAAIQLALRGHRVLILEKKRYPSHKLCGEFLSVEVQTMLERLGVVAAVLGADAQSMNRVCITTAEGAVMEQTLPGTALGLSRYTLDRLLFDHGRAAGADAVEGVSVRAVHGSLGEGFEVETTTGRFEARLVLGAYGKRSLLDRKLNRPFLQQPSPFVAFKAHYEGLSLSEVIELHAFPGGYCGLSPVEGDRVNACWIADTRVLKAAGGTPEAMIAHTLSTNRWLAHRLATMERVSERFASASQLTFTPKGAWAGDVCMIGDTAGMIAPMCGDGMAMALRAAELAVPLASAYLNGALQATSWRVQYRDAWRREFGLRMRLGRWMHHAYCHPVGARLGVHLGRRMPGLGNWLIRKTRGM